MYFVKLPIEKFRTPAPINFKMTPIFCERKTKKTGKMYPF